MYFIQMCVFSGAPKATDYLSEIREFEAEMMKHTHKYPHDILATLCILLYRHGVCVLLLACMPFCSVTT